MHSSRHAKNPRRDNTGGQFSGPTEANQIVDRVEELTGVRITVHQFRHAAGALILKHHPGNYELVRRILGHKSIETTRKFYIELETTQASEIYAEIIRPKLDFGPKAA